MPRRRFALLALLSIGFANIDNAQAELMPQEPKTLTRLDDHLRNVRDFAYDPRTESVIFSAQPIIGTAPPPIKIYRVPVTGGPIRPLTFQPNDTGDDAEPWVIAPDGQHILFRQSDHSADGDLFYLSIDSGSLRQLTFDDNVGDFYGLNRQLFARNGEYVVFRSHDPNRLSTGDELFSVPVDGSTPQIRLNGDLLGFGDSVRTNWAITADGNRVLYMGDLEVNGRIDLHSVDVTGGESQQINTTEGLQNFILDPDDNIALYTSQNGPSGRTSIYSHSLSGGAEIEITPGFATRDDTAISFLTSAGSEVVFRSNARQPGVSDLYAVPIRGGTVRRLDDVGNGTFFLNGGAQISPRGDFVIFSVTNSRDSVTYNQTVYQYDLASDTVTTLGDYSTRDQPHFVSIDFSSDGSHFAVYGNGFTPTLFNGNGEFLRQLDGVDYVFHPDGEHLLFIDGMFKGGSILVNELFMESIDGTGERFHLSDDDEPIDHVMRYTVSEDDPSVVLYMRGDSRASSQPRLLYSVSLVPEPTTITLALATLSLFCLNERRMRLPLSHSG